MTQTSLFWTTSGSGDGSLAGYPPERIWALLRSLSRGGDGIAHDDDLAVTLASGTATVAPGAAMVSGIPYLNDANVTLSVGAATAQNRLDRVVLRAVWQAQTVRAVLKAGTEGSLTPPTLTQQRGGVYEVPLAIVGASVDRVLSANLTVTTLLFVRSVEVGNGYTLEVANGAQVVLEDVAKSTDARTQLSMVAAAGVTSSMLASDAVTTAELANSAVTNAKLADMAEATVKGRAAGSGTGAPVDLTAAQVVDILETVDGASSGLDADLLDGVHAADLSPVVHTHSGYSAIAHTHTGYSAVVHTHNGYAAVNHLHPNTYAALVHVHSGYADLSHTHTIYSPTTHTHDGYAVTAHNHDGAYSATVHTHDGYAVTAHDHDGVYAPSAHTHTSYATADHDHGTDYAATVHTHAGYATAAHNHDGAYAATVHTHSGYATAAHNHDGAYSATVHTHASYAVTAHTHGTSTIADDAVTNAKLAAMAEATVKGRAVGSGTGAPADLTVAQLAAIVASEVPTRIFSTNTTISSGYITEWVEVGNGVALEVGSTGTVTLADGRTAHLDADTLDGVHAAGLSPVVHTHSGYSAVSHTHTGYSAIAHTHSGYAALEHTHFGYSAASHTHTQYSAIVHTHSGYSAVNHTHTSTGIDNDAITNAKLASMGQATIKGRAHNSGTGAPVDLSAAQVVQILSTLNGSFSGLDADLLDGQEATAFAVTSHNHDGVYAPTSHNHDMPDPAEGYIDLDTIYSRTTHNHGTRYAVPAHNHDGEYSPTAHNHNDTYAVETHNHDGTYALTAHTHGVATQTYGFQIIGQSATVYRQGATKVAHAYFNVSWSSAFEFNTFWALSPNSASAWTADDIPLTGTATGSGFLVDNFPLTFYRLNIKIASDGIYMRIADPFTLVTGKTYTVLFSVAYI